MSRTAAHSDFSRGCRDLLILALTTTLFIYSSLSGVQSLCDNKLCLGGSCDNSTGSEICNCSQFYTSCILETSLTCANITDFCSANSTCADESNGDIRCDCNSGFSGSRCEIGTCGTDFCSDNGTCMDHGNGTKTCLCNSGWFGDQCDRDKDDCTVDSPCQNGATCTDENVGYRCNCTVGWAGENCEMDVDECSLSYCFPENTDSCNNTDGSYLCSCKPGYAGNNCTEVTCTDPTLCGNGGTCLFNVTHWWCQCPDFYEGDQCQIKGPCVDSPCAHGNCSQYDVGSAQQHNCTCDSGWSNASTCADDVDECLNTSACRNGGVCVNMDGSFRCNCTLQWAGLICADDVKECSLDPTLCLNGGACMEEEGNYRCNCANTGWRGRHCELIDRCATSCNVANTVNGSSCVDLGDRADCICADGYIGLSCNMTDPCLSNPCQDQGTCTPNNDTFSCDCGAKYTGRVCDTLIELSNDVDLVVVVVVPIVAALALAAIIGLIVCFVMAKKKRATRGRYSPSRNEIIGPNLQMSGVLKPPPEERLI